MLQHWPEGSWVSCAHVWSPSRCRSSGSHVHWMEVHCSCQRSAVFPARRISGPASVVLLRRWWYLQTLLQPTVIVCIYMTMRRYLPVLIGPQKSMATSFQGSLGSGDICSGSHPFAGVTTWHGWQCWMWASTIPSKPGNQTLVLRYSFVFVTPWCPSWGSRTTFSRSDLGTTSKSLAQPILLPLLAL